MNTDTPAVTPPPLHDLLALDPETSSTADVARAAAGWQLLGNIAGERYAALRNGALTVRLDRAAADQGVDGLTIKVPELGKVTRTAPEPRPRIEDDDALASWLDDLPERPVEVEWRDRVVVVDHAAAAAIIRKAGTDVEDDGELLDLRDRLLRIERTAYLPPVADVVAALVDAGLVAVTDTRVVELATGVPVPGFTVDRAAPPQTRITVDAAVKREVAARFDAVLPPAVTS